MKTKRTLTIATALVALAVLMTLGSSREMHRVHAQDTAPSSLTHLNVLETNVVNLVGTSTSNLREVGHDGSSATTDYTVPAGKVLVVTDITTTIEQADEKALIPLSLRIFIGSNSQKTIFRMPVKTDNDGYAKSEHHFTAGLMVGPGNKLQLQGNAFIQVINASVLGYTVSNLLSPQ
jgi:hypothetical protein